MSLNKAQTEFYLTVNDPSIPDVVRFEASKLGLEALVKFNQERDDKDLSFDPDGGLRVYAKAFRTYASLRLKFFPKLSSSDLLTFVAHSAVHSSLSDGCKDNFVQKMTEKDIPTRVEEVKNEMVLFVA